MEIDYGVGNLSFLWIKINHYLSDRGVFSRDSKLNKQSKVLKFICCNINGSSFMPALSVLWEEVGGEVLTLGEEYMTSG